MTTFTALSTERFNQIASSAFGLLVMTAFFAVPLGTVLAGCASVFIPTKTRTISAWAAHSVGAVHGFPEEGGNIFRDLSAKTILLTASSEPPVTACRRFLKAYQKSAGAFHLSRIEMAVATCEEAGDYKTAEVFLDFKTRHLESHPTKALHYKSQWQRRSKATLRKDFEEYLSEQPRYEPTVNYTQEKSGKPAVAAYDSVIPYYHYERK